MLDHIGSAEKAFVCLFFFSSRRRHTRSLCDWSSDVCSSDLFTETYQLIFGKHQFKDIKHSVEECKDKDMTYSAPRSEERRVGKECRSRWSRENEKKKAGSSYNDVSSKHSNDVN